ncbi:MAG: LamG domain-containing protein, partial [Thermoguttaceae bacterium]|nr:LamG domain-containing protein [Thermoguttaceae bacterium]
MLRNCLSALLNSLSNNFSGEKDSRKIKRQKTVSRTRTLRFEPCEDRTMLSVSPFNSEDVTALWTFDVDTEDTNGAFVGTLNNGASLTTNGIAGGGLSLDGVDDYFSIGDPEELQIINEITLSAWIIPESASGTQNIIAKGYSTHPNGEIFLRIANGKYQVGSWTGSNHMAEFAIPSSDIGERVHLAGTYDGTTWRLYRNGVEIASTVDSIGAVEVDGAWAVGARGTGTERFFNGVIDEVVISSSVYTAQEIAALASIPTNAQEDNSVTWNWSDVQSGELYSEQGDCLGTLSSAAVVQFDSAYGQVLNLFGNNGYVSLGNPDDLQIHGEITLSAWICPISFTGIQNIIAKGHTTNPKREIALRINNGQYQVGSWDGSNHYASVAADAEDIGQWILLTGVYDGTTWQLYKNGVLAASLPSTVGAVPVSADWSIGSNSNGADRFFNGKIGNGGIYDHALDAQSVAALITDSQTTARVGGNPYAIKDQSYVLQLDASNPDVLWTVNWGDGTTEEYYNVSSVSHVYTHYGTSGVSVTAKRNGQTIDVAGSSISLQIGSVDEMIINGNFEDVAIPNGTYWAVYNSISGWTGPVEIQVNNGSKVAELDTDSRYSGLAPSVSDHQPHHTSISSSPLSFTPGLTYTLSFDAWNRSDYAQDNILNVTVPGEIISVNGNTPVSTLLDLIDENDLGAFSFTSISYDSVTFSAGGSYYETDDGNGGTVYTLGASPFHVSSITFIAANDYGTVSFSDVSSDVVPCYGPLLDNISMNQEYLYVDIDVDSNNDGVINAFDDPVEMAPNGGKILAVGYGQCKPINLSVHTNQTNLASDNIVYQLEYDNSKILLYNTAALPQAVYGTEIDISPYYIAPNTDLPNGFLTLDGTIKTIYVDGFVLGETTVTLK